MSAKKKIAILGGGLGGISTAYWLTEKEQWQDDYEITIYQMGWRLGGKGASARNVKPGYGYRIQEHGLHIWFGFYENAFRTMRQALEQLGEYADPPVKTFGSWREAFRPHSLVHFEENVDGRWVHWPVLFPPNDALPGDADVIELWPMIETLVGWLRTLYDQFSETSGRTLSDALVDKATWLPEWAKSFVELAADAAGHTLLELLALLAKHVPESEQEGVESIVVKLTRVLLDAVWALVDDDLDDDETRRFWILLDLAGTFLIGILDDDLFRHGFESVDGDDFGEWLTRHGAKPVTVQSALIRTIYDLVFGFDQGDTTRPNFAAGTAVRGTLRMLLTYKGSLMYKMCAGMGDTIFTPLYGLLKKRGVRFEFFHKVEELTLDPDDATQVGAIRLARQVTLKPEVEANGGYWPFVEVKGLDCWPSVPNFDQIVEGEALRHDPHNPGQPYDLESWWTSWGDVGQRVLERGTDFDLVVLATSIAPIPYIAPSLVASNADWKRMLEGDADSVGVQTVQTQGVQLWLAPSATQLGWTVPAWAREAEEQAGQPLGLRGLAGGYAQDLNTYCDLSGLLDVEDWPADNLPATIAYFCGTVKDFPGAHPFDDYAFPRQANEAVRAQALAWFRRAAAHLWPNGSTRMEPAGVNPNLLIDPEGGVDDARFGSQFYRVNIDPNERYVLTVKGSTQNRLAPGASGFANLYLAGDWTHNGVLNAGCVEASVASGMEAARAIGGVPSRIAGEYPD
ncbi:MAG: NAD(P)-binding protein [Myxococcales bacterium]|nr:NAD(P)-binding protein [Myxococcales bacterium]